MSTKSKTMPSGRNWLITVFDTDLCDLDGVIPKFYTLKFEDEMKHFRYCVGQLEVTPTTGKKHIQAYFEFVKNVRPSAIKKFLGCECHCEKRRGTQEEAIAYCSKEDSQVCMPFECGVKAEYGVGGMYAGGVIDWIKKNPESTFDDYVNEYEMNHLRYKSGMKMLWDQFHVEPLPSLNELRDWQKWAVDRLMKQDDRKVLWITDEVGGAGKTVLSKHLCAGGKGFYCSGGSYKDIMYSYKNQNVVVIDLTRSQREYIPYDAIESFKNGLAFSAKYESQMKIFAPAKVIVMSNFDPSLNKLSMDRWELVTLLRGEGNNILTPKIQNLEKCQIDLNID